MRGIRKSSLSIAGFVAILALGGCEGNDGLPAGRSPIAPTVSAASASATIQGTISSALPAVTMGSSAPSRTTGRAAGMTVSVDGTNLTTVANSRGRFRLTGVRPGPVRLRFAGSGVNDFIQLRSVAPGDTIIFVTVVGTRVVLESDGTSSKFVPTRSDDDEDSDDSDDDDNEADDDTDDANGR